MTDEKNQDFVIVVKDGYDITVGGFYPDGVSILEMNRGEGKLCIGTEAVSVTEGDFVYIPRSLVFRLEAAGQASVRIVTFNLSLVEEYMQKLDSELFYMFYVQSETKIPVFKPDHPVYEQLAFAVSEACDEYAAKDVCFSLTVRANIFILISAILRSYFATRGEHERQVYHNVMRLRPALEYIREHCTEKIYIDTLADMVNVSADYFTKVFKESIGKTPVDYINAVRVNKALELLSETETPINEIADKAGFSNPNYFHKIFKAYMDTSPLSYRKNCNR
ncbi:MAG: helix-turn-helix transcriptional regulator [Clostridia bacterium]|nr:helix-turn-helix transcriptional regulator [Clostridia bacterium]